MVNKSVPSKIRSNYRLSMQKVPFCLNTNLYGVKLMANTLRQTEELDYEEDNSCITHDIATLSL